MVGSAMARALQRRGFVNVVSTERHDTDLMDRCAVERLFSQTRPDYVFFSAARVGGIMANKTYPAEFLEQNLQIQLNVMRSALDGGGEKDVFFREFLHVPEALSPADARRLLTGGAI